MARACLDLVYAACARRSCEVLYPNLRVCDALSGEEVCCIIGSYHWTCEILYQRVNTDAGFHFCHFALLHGSHIIERNEDTVPADIFLGRPLTVACYGLELPSDDDDE